ncbi:uncharacterized protein LOC143191843 isoform X2 [Rhynchophorus ferrugineus]|uniref:uncharacterized protein LOC143191843 isoform X2 n=1 Tax=Rhynchophorus ferrugineus TaxID=354439 RepID=UPI003FCC5C08
MLNNHKHTFTTMPQQENRPVAFTTAPTKPARCKLILTKFEIKPSGDTIKTKKQEIYHESSVYPNERLQEARDVKKSNSSQVIVNSRTDLNGVYPKRYVTTCYIKPKVLPIWYTESVLIFIGSTKRKYDEKVYFKNKTLPYYWSENMTTEVNFPPTKTHISEITIPTEQTKTHYMSLEPQQLVAAFS